MSDMSVSQFDIVTPLCYICTNNKEKGKTMEHITEDGIIYNMDDLYCPECGDVYAPTVGYCDATLRCTGVALLPVDQMF